MVSTWKLSRGALTNFQKPLMLITSIVERLGSLLDTIDTNANSTIIGGL